MKRHGPLWTVRDPVCGMMLSKRGVVAHRKYKGKTYYFCAKVCCDMFELHPERYLRRRRGSRTAGHCRTHQHQQHDIVRVRHA